MSLITCKECESRLHTDGAWFCPRCGAKLRVRAVALMKIFAIFFVAFNLAMETSLMRKLGMESEELPNFCFFPDSGFAYCLEYGLMVFVWIGGAFLLGAMMLVFRLLYGRW